MREYQIKSQLRRLYSQLKNINDSKEWVMINLQIRSLEKELDKMKNHLEIRIN